MEFSFSVNNLVPFSIDRYRPLLPSVDRCRQSAKSANSAKRNWTPKANYLVYDDHRDAPVGFGIRVGKTASTFLVEKKVAGKKLKIHVGLARGRKGAEKPIELAAARAKAFELVAVAKKHGANPKKIAEKVTRSGWPNTTPLPRGDGFVFPDTAGALGASRSGPRPT